MNYKVKITQSGRGGTIYYLDNDKQLLFGWEFAIDGALLFYPQPPDWKDFFETNDLSQFQNRRDEIVERVCKEVVRQQTSGGIYTIEKDYISISFRAAE